MEGELRGRAEQLLVADRRKNEFLATLAHELRNPLAPIRNGLQIWRLCPGDAALMEQTRDMMERQLGQMVRLVDDLLDLSRVSRGTIELRKERIQLMKIIEQAIETSLPTIKEAGHELTIDAPPSAIYVDADLTRMGQVFANILNNAAKYTQPGGRIRVAVEQADGEAVISIKDDGVGIPADMLPNVFDMFTQVDRNLDRSQGGLGIGLSIVRRLVEMHEGTVEAKSAGVGTGSEFIVRLPVALSIVSSQAAPDQSARATNQCRILVVDDNRDAAASLAMMLRLMGHETKTANDGMEALNVAAQFHPDIMLLDIGMPHLNGHDTARRIRSEPWGQGIFLAALTGWGQDEDRRKSKEAGFDAHMVKPIELAALETMLSAVKQRTSDARRPNRLA
jgi:CheY-like chemotaxis protein/two-component sensor histidine kinase